MSEEKTIVIINNEDGMCNAGLAGEKKVTCKLECKVNKNEAGIIQNWDEIEKVWKNVFDQLKVDAAKSTVILTEEPFNAKENREKMVSLMFETFKVEALFIGNEDVFALWAAGRTNGVTLRAKGNEVSVVPVYPGYAVKEAITKVNIEEKGAKEFGKIINEQIMKCAEKARKELYKNIACLGDASKLQPIVAELTQAIKEQTQETVKVVEFFDVENPCWVGGSILGCLPGFQPLVATKQEFEEKGIEAILAKFK